MTSFLNNILTAILNPLILSVNHSREIQVMRYFDILYSRSIIRFTVAQKSFSSKDTVDSEQALILSGSIVLFENAVLYSSARRNIWSWSA